MVHWNFLPSTNTGEAFKRVEWKFPNGNKDGIRFFVPKNPLSTVSDGALAQGQSTIEIRFTNTNKISTKLLKRKLKNP